MKTLVKVIFVVTVLFGTYSSYAIENSKNYDTHHFVSEGNRISVYDTEGNVIYSGIIKNSGNLMRLYDFTQLDSGVYTVEINKDFEIEVSSIEVKNKTVRFVSSRQKIFKPVFRNKDSRLIISKLGVDTNEMKVRLYYEDNLIYSDIVKGSQVLNRVYRLDKELQGEYTAVVKSNNRVYVENFRI